MYSSRARTIRRSGDERPRSRHRSLCPNRRRPHHRHSGAHAAPPQCANRTPALHLQPGSRRRRAGRQAGPARGRGDRLRPRAIHADDHRSPCRVARHAGQCPRTVSWPDADAGRPLYRADGVRDGRARPRRDDASRSDLVQSARRRACSMRWSGWSSCWTSRHWFPGWRR